MDLLAIDEVRRWLRIVGQSYLGVRAIPVARIVGSLDRNADFDRDLRPRRRLSRARLGGLRSGFPDGHMPAIEVQELGGLGDDALRLGSTCTSAIQEAHTASAVLADGDQVEGDLLVAADGVGSRLRNALLGPAATRATGLVAWRAVVPANGFDAEAVTGEAWGGGELFGAARLTKDQLYWFASARDPESSDRSEQAEREMLLERFADWHAPIPAIIDSTAPQAIIRTPLREIRPLETWVSGRVALLGDAAHAMLPNLGQGGCQAIEDAAALAASLAIDPDVPEALRAYERSRKPRAEKVARRSRQMSSLAHRRNPAAVALRNILMRATPDEITLRRLDDLVGRVVHVTRPGR